MGLCGSKLTPDQEAAKKRSKELEKSLHNDHAKEQSINKLLLLGAGESGKSTLFKQMISIYGKGFSPEDCQSYVGVIYQNIIQAMQELCRQSDILSEEPFSYDTKVAADAEPSKAAVLELKRDAIVTPEIGVHINRLWTDKGIRETYENRTRFQLTDSAAYYFNAISRISAEGYLPTEQDVLRSRVRTTGIVEQSFWIEENLFKMFDVGGQRSERKKWIHCFENVTAVLFVAALSAYDQVLYEDENVNRMHEALVLFDEISNSKWFEKTSMILFLNKKDIFAEKIEKTPLSVCFPDYSGLKKFDEAVLFIQNQFETRQERKKPIYTHVTCATDRNNMKHVFDAVRDIVIRRSLEEGGLLA